MFDINKEIARFAEFQQTKQCGLHSKPRNHHSGKLIKPSEKQALENEIDKQAERESQFMSRAYKNRTMNFGKRLRKHNGETHH